MKVKEIMTQNPETVSPGALIGDVARQMRDMDIGLVPVVSGDRLLGVITDRDITVRITAAGLNPFDTTVSDFVSPNPITVSPEDDVQKVRQLMADKQVRRILVTEDGKLVGIVSLGDLATKDSAEDKKTGEALQEISEPAKLGKMAQRGGWPGA